MATVISHNAPTTPVVTATVNKLKPWSKYNGSIADKRTPRSLTYVQTVDRQRTVNDTHLVWAWHRVLITTDFPPPDGPTIIVVCRVNIVSYICTTLSTWKVTTTSQSHTDSTVIAAVQATAVTASDGDKRNLRNNHPHNWQSLISNSSTVFTGRNHRAVKECTAPFWMLFKKPGWITHRKHRIVLTLLAYVSALCHVYLFSQAIEVMFENIW